jgi:hypothetical protein
MWEPRRLTTPWAFTACYRDSLTLGVVPIEISNFILYSNGQSPDWVWGPPSGGFGLLPVSKAARA